MLRYGAQGLHGAALNVDADADVPPDDDPEREERRARIRAWLANLPAEVAQVYEDLKRLDPKGKKREE